MFACNAGGPGFDSRLRRLVASVLPMLYAEDVGGPGQAPTVRYPSGSSSSFNSNYMTLLRKVTFGESTRVSAGATGTSLGKMLYQFGKNLSICANIKGPGNDLERMP